MDRHRGVEHMDSKVSQWLEGSSEDEAIDMLTAGASGSRALDERTSASTSPHIGDSMSTSHFLTGNQSAQSVHRVRPTDPSLVRPDNASIVPPEPLPSPSLSTLRQALQAFRSAPTYTANNIMGEPDAHHPDIDEEDDEDGASSTGERITLAQALMESRLPHLPPPVTQHLPQSSLAQVPRSGLAAVGRVSSDLRLSDAPSPHGRVGQIEVRRRRWSVLEGLFSNASGMLLSPPFSYEGSNTTFPPEVSFSSRGSLYTSLHVRPEATQNHTATSNDVTPVVSSQLTSQMPLRFLQRNLNNTHHNRRADVPLPMPLVADVGKEKGNIHLSTASHVPPPRLEYVKLPGTKGSLIVKAVETPKKSFLAILCGENGEKVELFAGTYRSALGLSRTFILPDSPRSLELQLQGDDLVEVFLVFSQNVFGLEPATVRVREVRIGRAERRAARRRVREIRSGQTDIFEGDLLAPDDEDANISINIGVSLAGNESRITRTTSNSQLQDIPRTSTEMNHDTALAHAEELVAMTTTHMGPYTTFQQLSFAPKFPLATIANDYIIPPTYPQFLEYRSEYEPGNSDADLSQTQFSPPGLPKPVPTPPSKWLYRDPKGATHGPWKASLMQAWYNDGLLPPDLPVRKEQDTQFILLKDLRQQSIDPSHPFRLVAHSGSEPQSSSLDVSKPLLSPVSLLAQPRHFGPPALFYSSRGGHSTTIVDARGRSVLQGRFLWSEDSGQKASESSMGDIKHLEAFDVEDRSVIVAMRQGGLEAMDFGDALLKPADQSRTVLPHFTPSPSNINRREPFVWKIGTPIASSFPPAAVVPSKATSSYPGRKRAVKTARGTGASINGVHEAVGQNEVLFLGREGDIIYLCERTANTFKILRLCPGHSVAS
ncbi:hypothetical protein SERLA73DRAFT_174037 [Serpula lacrymans var. lacrymans S7.3]|uniref:GYF domain-containing protein n=1 Tax=Serpula lacrymans var. lacrymans (strain S7.3) TaxID=936435 RepID=F8PHB2_SERL3|nr:hypothetical protein SERLA73DRAFT_174037 [Serpula lacrymans var. lacrymans S7.3]